MAMAEKKRSWQSRLDELIARARAEASGERGQRFRQNLEQAREQIGKTLHSSEVQKVRREAAELGDKALAAVDDAIKSERATEVLGRIDSAASELTARAKRAVDGPPATDDPPTDQPPSDQPPDSKGGSA